ncbi:hypothetical protein Tco_0522768, partial [Tanacetum coccineum]
EKVGGNKNKGWKPWRCPSAGCASSASSSTKGVKNGNGGRLSTSGLADVELSLLWLDVGEGKEVDLKECPRSKLRKQCIKLVGRRVAKNLDDLFGRLIRITPGVSYLHQVGNMIRTVANFFELAVRKSEENEFLHEAFNFTPKKKSENRVSWIDKISKFDSKQGKDPVYEQAANDVSGRPSS